MQTIDASPKEMESQVARFQELKRIPAMQNGKVPLEAGDQIYARKLPPIISSSGGVGPFWPSPYCRFWRLLDDDGGVSSQPRPRVYMPLITPMRSSPV